ncbi:DUF1566 domain-containing protein [Acinetobacter dispersus]|uniref:Lcl C-terminal domain-containing protein n=1 Tax=Acinetobacter dispersus TaxID=70348 RepID=UPI001F4A148D|nr:DUF1566 domain-containing protein [Acinetobacter dispersus]MCH7393769.1 DUF1566 domain-containing protein [Acinetobacter dispersus]
MKISKLSCLLIISTLLISCGGDNKSKTQNEPINSTQPTVLLKKTIQPQISTDVSLEDSKKIAYVSSQNSISPKGKPLEIEVIDLKKQGLLIAADASENPLLLSIEENNPIGIDSTAYAVVVILMKFADLPSDISVESITSKIRSAPSFNDLKKSIEQNLSENIIAFDDENTIEVASDVLDEAIRANVKTSVSQRTLVLNNEEKISDINAIAESESILPYYFFKLNDATEKIWLSDAESSGITLNNRTFITWNVVLKNANGEQVFKDKIGPMIKTDLQKYAAFYKDSESKIKIPTSLIGNQFTIEVGQNADTDNINAINLLERSTFAIIDISTGFLGASQSKVQECSIAVSKALIRDPAFSRAITSTNSQDWKNYIKSLFPKIPDLITKSCNTVSTKGGFENGTLVAKKLLGKINNAFEVARETFSTISGFYQMSTHIRKIYSKELCFENGQVENCIPPVPARYTKIGSTGQKLLDSAGSWNCVIDNDSGLMWELKQNGANDLRSKSKTYSFTFDSTKPEKYIMNFNQSVNQLPNGLCSYKDWRVPTASELNSLFDHETSNSLKQYLNIKYFTDAHSNACFYWTKTMIAGDPKYFFGADFCENWEPVIPDDYYYAKEHYVRLVRGTLK